MRPVHPGRFAVLLTLVALAAMLAATSVFAQTATLKPETVAGNYQGTATTAGGDISLTIALRVDDGKITGSIESSAGRLQVTSGTVTGDRILLNADMDGQPATLTGTYKDGRVEGTWSLGADSGAFVVTKSGGDTAKAAAPAGQAAPAAQGAKPATSADPISGQWDGITGEGDMTRAFTLTLKLDGEKVTGDISSDQGGTALSSGVWKDGTLTLTFAFGDMSVTMVGALKEAKLVGTLDLSGQMQMPWGAVKK